ncbi:MAG: hypothetical protein ACREML_02160 [Vulcanimicrobiaceae bacterium]
MNPFLLLRLVALVPLVFFGIFGVVMLTSAIVLAPHDLAKALIFAAIALFSTLGYPAMIDVERRFSPPPSPLAQRLPMKVHDAFFLGGGAIAAWKLGPRIDPLESLAVALFLWIIASGAARHRAAELEASVPKPKS